MRARSEAIAAILERHGTDAVYVASTGFISRAVFGAAGDRYQVFYMQGSMGMAPAIGLGLALRTARPVVVINGDGALLMSLGTTHTVRAAAPPNLFHYVLANGCHESVGGQPCAPLDDAYPGVTEVIRIDCEGKAPRVALAPVDNTRRIRRFLGPAPARPAEAAG
jgi:thiamine pyrophosphate-dependent acetolactate synthase large subunit-like protein